MKDSQGNKIEPGEFIAYGLRIGNSGALGAGLVIDVDYKLAPRGAIKLLTFKRGSDEIRTSVTYSPERTIVVPPGNVRGSDKLMAEALGKGLLQ